MRVERREHVSYKLLLPSREPGVIRELTIDSFGEPNGITEEEVQAMQDGLNALAERRQVSR